MTVVVVELWKECMWYVPYRVLHWRVLRKGTRQWGTNRKYWSGQAVQESCREKWGVYFKGSLAENQMPWKGQKEKGVKIRGMLRKPIYFASKQRELGGWWGPLGTDTPHACTWRGWPTTFPCTQMHKHYGLRKGNQMRRSSITAACVFATSVLGSLDFSVLCFPKFQLIMWGLLI